MTKKLFSLFCVFVVIVLSVLPVYADSAGSYLVDDEPYIPYGRFSLLISDGSTDYNVMLSDDCFDTSVDNVSSFGNVSFTKHTDFFVYPSSTSNGTNTVRVTNDMDLGYFEILCDSYLYRETHNIPAITIPAEWSGFVTIDYDVFNTAENGYTHYSEEKVISNGGRIDMFTSSSDFTDVVMIRNYRAVFSIPISLYATTVSGKYVLNDYCVSPSTQINQTVNFSSNNANFAEMVIWSSNRFYYRPTANTSANQVLVYNNNAWVNTTYKAIDFGAEPQIVSDTFYSWLDQNAVKQSAKVDLTFEYDVNTTSTVNKSFIRFLDRLGVHNQDLGYASGLNFHNTSWVDWIVDAVGGFMDFELFPGFSIGGVLSVTVVFAIVILFLKFFAGG